MLSFQDLLSKLVKSYWYSMCLKLYICQISVIRVNREMSLSWYIIPGPQNKLTIITELSHVHVKINSHTYQRHSCVYKQIWNNTNNFSQFLSPRQYDCHWTQNKKGRARPGWVTQHDGDTHASDGRISNYTSCKRIDPLWQSFTPGPSPAFSC